MKSHFFFWVGLAFFGCFARQPIGLQNCGNTCYINAVTQLLLNADQLLNILSQWDNPYLERYTPMQYYFQLIMRDIITYQQKKGPKPALPLTCFNPNKKSSNLGKYDEAVYKFLKYRPGTQQDAGEFLQKFLPELANSTLSEINNAITNLFAIPTVQQLNCPGYPPSLREKSEWYIPVAMSTAPTRTLTLHDLLQHFFAPEHVEYTPEGTTKPINCEKQFSLDGLPAYLFIALGRFAFDLQTGQSLKIEYPVIIPDVVSLTPFLTERFGQATFPPHEYELIGYAYHEGPTACNGHYYSFIKQDEKWYHADDRNITLLSGPKQRDTGYIYLYKRIDVTTGIEYKTVKKVPPLSADQELTLNFKSLQDTLETLNIQIRQIARQKRSTETSLVKAKAK